MSTSPAQHLHHLRLPRPSHPWRRRSLLARSISTHIRPGLRLTAEPPLSFCDSWNPLILHLDKRANRSGATGLLARRLLVGSQVETDEEEEITAENTDTSESGKFFTGTAAGIGHPGEVGVGAVRVMSKLERYFLSRRKTYK